MQIPSRPRRPVFRSFRAHRRAHARPHVGALAVASFTRLAYAKLESTLFAVALISRRPVSTPTVPPAEAARAVAAGGPSAITSSDGTRRRPPLARLDSTRRCRVERRAARTNVNYRPARRLSGDWRVVSAAALRCVSAADRDRVQRRRERVDGRRRQRQRQRQKK